MLTRRLPYRPDPAGYYAALRDLPWPAWLDSGRPAIASGRYDIMTAAPWRTLVTGGGGAQLTSAEARGEPGDDPLQLLRAALPRQGSVNAALPFAGGAIGFLGYDLARRWMRLEPRATQLELPTMAVGIYDWALIIDHHARRAWLGSMQLRAETAGLLDGIAERLQHAPDSDPPGGCHGRLRAVEPDAGGYARAFGAIQAYIRDGDCYQVNLTRRFAATVDCAPWDLYRRARQRNPAPYGALLEYPFGSVLSSSPEQFLSLQQDLVQTRPIKGTRPRGADAVADETLRRALQDSAKDRAENLMIVDLLRNDLGQVCRPGSVRVPELFAVESFATVHHLVSTVSGRLAPGRDAFDLLRACFPGGSITGAPKLRAMQIIDELEPGPREVYCGSIFRLGYDGALDSNIAIRTMLLQGGRLSYWAGGGIVADSACAAELQETLDKAAAFLDLLGGDPAQSSQRS